jgi:hypothetical protein
MTASEHLDVRAASDVRLMLRAIAEVARGCWVLLSDPPLDL